MIRRSGFAPGLAQKTGRNFQNTILVKFWLVLLIFSCCLPDAAHAAGALEAWRGNADKVRILAENDAPRAYDQAQHLQQTLPTDASPADRARVLNLLARIEIYLALTDRAAKHIQLALDLANQYADRIGQAEAWLNLALNSVNQGKLDVLVTASNRSLAALDGQNRPDLLAEALVRASMMYRRVGQLDESVTMAMQTMEIAKRSKNALALTYAHQGLGISFQQSDRPKEAREHFLQMRDQARAAHSTQLEAYALTSLGGVTGTLGDERTAEALIREGISRFREIGVPIGLNHGLFALAERFRIQHRYADVAPILDEIIATYEKYPNKIGLWFTLNARSANQLSLGNRVAALADAERAYALAKEMGQSIYWSESAQRIAAITAAGGDYRQAYKYSLEAAEMTAKTAREKAAARMAELAQRYETESKQREIDELTRRNQQQMGELRQRELQQRWLWGVLISNVTMLAITAFFLLRLRRSHAIIRSLNASLEQRVQARTSELRQQTRYLRTLIDTLPWWVWLKDTSSRYLAVNQAAADTCGLSADDLVGKSDLDLRPRELADAFRADDLDVMSSRRHKTVEERQIVAGGTAWMETFKAPVLDEDGTVLGTVGFARDISERKAVEAAREAALAEAQRLAQVRSDFLAQMSHELRTPLNGILGYAQILRRDKSLGEQQLAGLNVIQQSGEHLLTLINDILDLAKIEAGKLELYPSNVSLPRFLNAIAEMIWVKAEQKGLDFLYDPAPELPAMIRADEMRLRQVLLNLLANAVKFTDGGCVRLSVRFSPPSRFRFDVQDSGIGIREDHLDAIFQPFEQTGEMQRRLGGTGLGLAITRQFVRLMDGDMHVESRIGQGSRFWFELELPVVDDAIAETDFERIVSGYQGARKTILVVDDVAENRTVVVDMLGRLGFQMAQASDGRDAFEKASTLKPDLILMDIVMPVMDGLEATRRLRQLPGLEELPIIAISASASDQDRERYLAAGLNAFLPKPIDYDSLLVQIALLLKLAWTYELPQAEPSSQEASGPLKAPPLHEMEVLHRLARIGNMNDILQRASYLAELDERYRPFASKLNVMAGTFQSKAILRFVEGYLQTEART